MLDPAHARTTLVLTRELALLGDEELDEALALFHRDHPLAAAVADADTLHAHVKVDDCFSLPHERLSAAGGIIENGKDGYVKYAFQSGVNLIFSSIAISEDDLRESSDARRPRPRLDHLGIDLRRETEAVKAVFDSTPGRASALGWTHVPQGGEGKPVFCCHTHVRAKHWVFPSLGGPSIEVAFGPLAITPGKSGCDLRPSDPRLGLERPACMQHHEDEASDVPRAAPTGGYYAREDLARFGDMGKNGGGLTRLFFEWYGAVFAEGALTAREKSLIALAVAHAVQCPYCIDAYSNDATKKGASLDQLTEAVHVAAAIRGGASLVHGVQMRAHVHRATSHDA